ncbi:MAG: pirin family protein, partial [Betaproteobacteria bacterium]
MAVLTVLSGHIKDLGGGFMIRRLLPAAERRSVGPFVFMDHFGPITQQPDDNFDVRPHPHIGLATVTYLFEGAMMHRDSLGTVQRIEPGAINWMSSGRGIVHSERSPEDLRRVSRRLHGLQLWVALPVDAEESEPTFAHAPAATLPVVEQDRLLMRVLIGRSAGVVSPVATLVPTLYLDVEAEAGGTLDLPADGLEKAVYALDESLMIDGVVIEPQRLALVEPDRVARVVAPAGGRYVVIGGERLDGRRHIWWNFVSSNRERIESAKRDWKGQRMGTVPG